MENKKALILRLIQERISIANRSDRIVNSNLQLDPGKQEPIAAAQPPIPEDVFDMLLASMPPHLRQKLWNEHLKELKAKGEVKHD